MRNKAVRREAMMRGKQRRARAGIQAEVERTPAQADVSQSLFGSLLPPPPERALPVSLLRAREAVMAHMRPILRAHVVTEQQWRVLRALDVRLPVDKTTLCDRATLLMPSLLRIIEDIQRAGWVRLVPSSANARLFGVVLTPKGKDFVDKVSRKLAAKGVELKRAIGEEDTIRLLDLLAAVEVRLKGLV
jgi:homoprotocatechuate degradation regulator HpaR